jgi:hypothetical protein
MRERNERGKVMDDNKMYNLQPDVPAESQTMILVGPVNCPTFGELPLSMSNGFIAGAVPEAADNQPQGAPSAPLKEGAVRAINSVIGRVHESAILRERDGDF